MNQPLKLRTAADLLRFHRYVRSNRIRGQVRQEQFAANARNTVLLAFALPLEAAVLETDAAIPAFEARR